MTSASDASSTPGREASPGGRDGLRRRAREAALQVLYALDAQGALGGPRRPGEPSGPSADELLEPLLARHWRELAEDVDPSVVAFAERLVRGAVAQAAELDELIGRSSRNWRLERMARVDRNILRLAAHELRDVPETPARVVINEAIEIAKRFGTTESGAFVNGLLDRIAQLVRGPG